MNIEHARTFLAVADTGSFIGAAQRLHVTQSTVSARIRALEDNLGRPLFTRNKAGAQLTLAGRRFLKHAGSIVRALEHARQDIGLPKQFLSSVVIGGRIGLWDALLMAWFDGLTRQHSSVSFRAEIGFEPDIMQGLIEGRIDIGVMYTPQRRSNLELLPLLTDRLVLVSSAGSEGTPDQTYVHIDWGPEFRDQFSAAYPEAPGPAITFNIGWLGLRYLHTSGGAGYFPYRHVEDAIRAGTLVIVSGAPEFDLPAWAVIRQDRDRDLIDPMIADLVHMIRPTIVDRRSAEA